MPFLSPEKDILVFPQPPFFGSLLLKALNHFSTFCPVYVPSIFLHLKLNGTANAGTVFGTFGYAPIRTYKIFETSDILSEDYLAEFNNQFMAQIGLAVRIRSDN